jgi:hypothetical protein
MGEGRWVGVERDDSGNPEDVRTCGAVGIGGGSSVLHDAIMRDHLAHTERTWIDRTVNPRGKKVLCTFDRGVAGNKIERVCSSDTSLALRVDVAILGPIGV